MGDLRGWRWDTNPWKFCSQVFTIVLCMSASYLSGKGVIKGWREPSCSGPRHVEGEVGWIGVGRQPSTWTAHCERESDSHKLIQHFSEPSLHLVTKVRRSFLCFLSSLICLPPVQLFLPSISWSNEQQQGWTICKITVLRSFWRFSWIVIWVTMVVMVIFAFIFHRT